MQDTVAATPCRCNITPRRAFMPMLRTVHYACVRGHNAIRDRSAVTGKALKRSMKVLWKEIWGNLRSSSINSYRTVRLWSIDNCCTSATYLRTLNGRVWLCAYEHRKIDDVDTSASGVNTGRNQARQQTTPIPSLPSMKVSALHVSQPPRYHCMINLHDNSVVRSSRKPSASAFQLRGSGLHAIGL